MDCCCLWVADPTALTSALSTDPEYLKNVGSGGDASGREFMTHFVMDGKFVIRLAVGGAMTEMRHVRDVWELLKDKANELVGGS
ncbi:tryptophan decarboxylase 2-like [Miscanthus floridulus]|uniref:tryptophan decarboxylase 2-like n=1 Tax=Miscanthus floridulus TaxID=154761 RepID=UPI00345AE85F